MAWKWGGGAGGTKMEKIGGGSKKFSEYAKKGKMGLFWGVPKKRGKFIIHSFRFGRKIFQEYIMN